MKIKNKGKVHPSPSSSSSPAPILATLQLLPATAFALTSVLPPPDQEVLSYLLARSLLLSSEAKPSSSSSSSSSAPHCSPSFACGCFDCYTIYWLRWDSSPNRDLIHRVIDAFEDHLSSSSKTLVGKGKVRRGRGGGRRAKDRAVNRMDTSSQESVDNGGGTDGNVAGSPRGKNGDDEENDGGAGVEMEVSSPGSPLSLPRPASPVSRGGGGGGGGGGEYKGLARKVLPDVLGILNSRLWNLWSPNV